MNPIPLSAPDGIVYAYACGECHHVHAGTHLLCDHAPKDVSEFAETYKFDAFQCCKCSDCDRKRADGEHYCWVCLPEGLRKEKAIRDVFAASHAEERAAYEESLTKAKNSKAAKQLEQLMREISEDYYCAGWLTGLETMLWDAVHSTSLEEDRANFEVGFPSQDELELLRKLSEQASGWWTWRRFVTLDEWEAIYMTRTS